MPRRTETHPISPDERRHKVVAILAQGVLRLRRAARIGGNMNPPKSQDLPENGLELSGETRLSVSDGTRRLRPRDDGDDS